MQRAHLPTWFAAVRSLENQVISAYLQGLLLLGCRREELAGLRWEDVDFRWSSIWIKDKIREEGRKIPLSPYFASLLATLPRRNQWVFSSLTAANGWITAIDATWFTPNFCQSCRMGGNAARYCGTDHGTRT